VRKFECRVSRGGVDVETVRTLVTALEVLLHSLLTAMLLSLGDGDGWRVLASLIFSISFTAQSSAKVEPSQALRGPLGSRMARSVTGAQARFALLIVGVRMTGNVLLAGCLFPM